MKEREYRYGRYKRQFEEEEKKILALKQPWHYYRLYVMYEIVEMINSDIDLSEHAVGQLGEYFLSELADLVIEKLEEKQEHGYYEPVWVVAQDLMEESERYHG